jgi:hypothetical protein
VEALDEYSNALAQYFTGIFRDIANLLLGGDADIDDIEFYR